jgi:hypothetical protein
MAANFPVRDGDGNFVIAARFSHSTSSPPASLEEILTAAITRMEAGGAPAFANQFRHLPVEEWQDDKMLDVVFEGRAESRVWKDWVVALLQELQAAESGLRFEGFIDRISGRFHPSWPC